MPQPNKIPLAFAASGDKNIIPESTETTGLASWRDGFPAITSAPFSEGGVAPKRADFNGIFNALSQAVMWMQQGGVYAYDADTDYEAGNVVLDAGWLYVANAANGPSSAVVQPSSDTTGATWKLVRLDLATQSTAGYMSAEDKTKVDNVILTNATQTAAGYMSAADKTLVDSIPALGTFNRMFFSQTSGSYVAPRTGVYRITIKGGGGGGGGSNTSIFAGGGGGAEGTTIMSYITLVKGQSYAYTIGAGGTAGSNVTSGNASNGSVGGASTFAAPLGTISAPGGGSGTGSGSNATGLGGRYGSSYASGGYSVLVKYGEPGDCGRKGTAFVECYANGGGISSSYQTSGNYNPARLGGGGQGGGQNYNGSPFDPQPGADGFLLIEYAD